MSVLSRPRHPRLGTATKDPAATTPVVPGQRNADSLQPWSPGDGPAASSPSRIDGRRRAALLLAGLAVTGAAAAGLLVAEPWDDGPSVIQAPTTTGAVTTADRLRDESLAGRAGDISGSSTDAKRDAVLEQRGPAGG